MERYRFTQQVKIGNQTFKVGINEVPEEIELHKDFLHFVGCGWISEAPPEVLAAQPVAVNQQAKKLADRIQKKLDDKKAQSRPAATKKDDGYTGSAETTEPVHEGDQGKDTDDDKLTPAQKAARTRAANAAKKT